MAIPKGITLVAGGGFHVSLISTVQNVLAYFLLPFAFSFFQGKSTLLDALAVGCYNHIPGGETPSQLIITCASNAVA